MLIVLLSPAKRDKDLNSILSITCIHFKNSSAACSCGFVIFLPSTLFVMGIMFTLQIKHVCYQTSNLDNDTSIHELFIYSSALNPQCTRVISNWSTIYETLIFSRSTFFCQKFVYTFTRYNSVCWVKIPSKRF